MRFPAFLIGSLLLGGSLAFAEEQKPADMTEKVTYEQHVLPILREKCGSCHNSNDKKGGLVLDNYTAAMQGGGSGEVIAPGDLSSSMLWLVITHDSEPYMPPNQPKLPDEQLHVIQKWIEQGALENAGSKARVKKQNQAVARVEITNARPADPPPMPENLPVDPLLVTSHANGVTALATNPWSPLAAVSGHKQVLLYNTQTLELVGVLPFPEGVPQVLKFSRNGQLLLAGGGRGGQSGRVVLFDVKTGQRVAEIGDEYDAVLAADISPDQSLVALGGPKKMLRVYTVATGELLYETKKHTDWLTAIEFSPDGVLLASGDRGNGLWVWEAATGREFYNLQGHTGMISDVSWRGDSNVLASASHDGGIRLWEMRNGTQVKNWNAHGGGAEALEFSRDGRIVSTGRDKVVKLWDQAGKQQRAFSGLSDIGMEVAFDSESDRILAGDWTGQLPVWSAAQDGPAVGTLTTNPPSLASRLEATQQALAAAQAESQKTAAHVTELQTAATQRKQTAEAAVKKATEAQAAIEPATKAKTTAEADLKARLAALQQAEAALKAAQAAFEQATAEKAAAEKQVAEAAAKLKTTTEQATALKTEAAKAAAAAQLTPEQQKALQEAEATAKAAAEKAAALKAKLDRLAAVKNRPVQTAGVAESP